MEAATIGIIGTILGFTIGGGINFLTDWSRFIRETRRQQQQLITCKLEENCLTVEEMENKYRQITGELYAALRTGQQPGLDITPLPITRLTMLINFYAPNLRDSLERLNEAQKIFGEVSMVAINQNQVDIRRRMAILFNAEGLIEMVCREITTGSSNVARGLV